MKFLEAAIVIMLSIAVQFVAAQGPGETTLGLMNGRFWVRYYASQGQVDSQRRLLAMVYLRGLYDGIAATAVELTEPAEKREEFVNNYVSKSLDVEQVRESLDKFYQEPLNLNIPIVRVLPIINAKAKGVPQASLDRMIQYARVIHAKQ
jgi:hypothetical protein